MGDGSSVKETVIIKKLSDETINNSAALQDDNELVVYLVANEYYAFEVNMLLDVNTGGFKAEINGPAKNFLGYGGMGAMLTSVMASYYDSNYNLEVVALAPGGPVQGFAVMKGVIRLTTAGNLIVRWAQNVAVANNSILKAGSYMMVWRI